MNSQIREFFRVDKLDQPHFQKVRFLNEENDLQWQDVEKIGLPRGWYELSRISNLDRVEFLKEFWLTRLSYHPKATSLIENFFDKLDDIVVLICRQTEEDPWQAELVYSLADNSTFFRGLAPAFDDEIDFEKKGIRSELPQDYWSFFKLHNGFGRLSKLGFMPLNRLREARDQLRERVLQSDKILRFGSSKIDPYSLFPFYEEYGVASFQCFNAEWYPTSEMGNVYFSGIDFTLSDISIPSAAEENMAFATFLEWLAAFLHGMNRTL